MLVKILSRTDRSARWDVSPQGLDVYRSNLACTVLPEVLSVAFLTKGLSVGGCMLVRMNYTVNGAWSGWNGHTIVEMTDGSIWKQDEYLYEYQYAYRPDAVVVGDRMLVDGMNSSVRVRRLK